MLHFLKMIIYLPFLFFNIFFIFPLICFYILRFYYHHFFFICVLSPLFNLWDLPTGLQIRVRTEKLFFLFLNQNICCGYSKNRLNEKILLSTQNMFKLMGKEINAILGAQNILIWTYVSPFFFICVLSPLFILWALPSWVYQRNSKITVLNSPYQNRRLLLLISEWAASINLILMFLHTSV